MSPTVVVFAPSPLLTVTIEDRAGEPDLHVHAGGQGVWQARMITVLGARAVLCAALGGELGDVLRALIPGEDMDLRAASVTARNGGYVHDRRDGDRQEVASAPGDALDRHEQDELYELALSAGIEHGTALLSGPHDDRIVPAAMYTRLARDLSANGCRVVADLSGERLDAVLDAGPYLVKISHEEMIDDGRANSEDPVDLVAGMRKLRSAGAGTVVVSRAGDPALALVGDEVLEVHAPPLEPAEPRGAGDSMTAGMTVCIARGDSLRTALRIGAACGALNVVRRGLGTGGVQAVHTLAERVELVPWSGKDE
ncbi:1-phosphofructokinase family hexose kinase [Pseudonocardia bannensis]|uniref:Phosphofructokinase n=1 Tax=Pseudonocardia bannensis TaxID=630973 RepID=A0A848DJ96_9PSEU|nr:PfkB family carbohydrate kinase [Pseudonocardia bannensis]NMH92551.1 phosphofructokinase [Pseudonocardia bannensis]